MSAATRKMIYARLEESLVHGEQEISKSSADFDDCEDVCAAFELMHPGWEARFVYYAASDVWVLWVRETTVT